MNNQKIAWKRVLYIRLTSNYNNKKVIEIGNTQEDSKKPRIVVVGHKYPSVYKDEFVIDIYNLSYKELIDIIRYKFYNVEIFAGYENLNVNKIFDGGIVYITNEKKEHNTTIAHLICASKLISRANVARNNFSIRSGMNMYSALQYINEMLEIKNANIDESFKERFIQESMVANKNIGSILDTFANSDNNIFVSTDSTNGEFYSIWSLDTSKQVATKIDTNKGMIIDGYPMATSEGIKFKSLPVTNYKPGMLISIDSEYIDVSVSSLAQAIETPLTVYMDRNGLYYIFQLDYSLDNYGTFNFYVGITAKSRDVLTNIIGQ